MKLRSATNTSSACNGFSSKHGIEEVEEDDEEDSPSMGISAMVVDEMITSPWITASAMFADSVDTDDASEAMP